jgi:hypothetical protein
VNRASGEQQHDLGGRRHRFGTAREQQLADLLGQRCSARLAGRDDVHFLRPQISGEPGNQRRFPGTFDTFDRDEPAARRDARRAHGSRRRRCR